MTQGGGGSWQLAVGSWQLAVAVGSGSGQLAVQLAVAVGSGSAVGSGEAGGSDRLTRSRRRGAPSEWPAP